MANPESCGCTFGGKTVILPIPGDPRFDYALAQGANSYTLPIGREPGRGYLVMEREDLEDIDFNEPQELKWSGSIASDGAVKTDDTFTIHNLYVVNDPIRLDASGDDNPRSLYLVEIADIRWLLERFTSINKAYNLRKPGNAFGGDTLGLQDYRYYTLSLNAGAVWTWDEIAEDIWGEIDVEIGTYPSLPYTPTGQPEDYRFFGRCAWESLHEVLAQVSCATNIDPTASDVTFEIVRLGADQDGIVDLITQYEPLQLHQSDPLAAIATRVPETIRIHFMSRDETRPDPWTSAPYTVDKTTDVDGALAGTVLNLWTSVVARYDADTAAWKDTATLDTIAGEIKDDWLATFNVNRRRNVFRGIVADLLPGQLIRAVQWRHDGARWTTTVSRRREVSALAQAGMWSETPPNERLHSVDRWIRFELSEVLSPGGSAEVQITYFDSDWTSPGGTVVVYDSIGDKTGIEGDIGWARWSPESERYEVIQLLCTPGGFVFV